MVHKPDKPRSSDRTESERFRATMEEGREEGLVCLVTCWALLATLLLWMPM